MRKLVLFFFLATFVAHTQATNCQIQTIGGSPTTFSPDGTPALQTRLASVTGIAIDSTGALYFSDSTNHRVRKVSANGTTVTVAGSGIPGFSGDGGTATAAQLNRPGALAIDSKGNLYIADTQNYRIRVVSLDGTIRTFAGSGDTGDVGDGGPPASAGFESLTDIAVGPDDSVYVADNSAVRVRKIAGGIIGAFAGTGVRAFGSIASATPAVQTAIPQPNGLAVDRAGNVYIATGAILKVAADGTISTIGGTGSAGDGRPAASTQMTAAKLAFDSLGNLYFYDSDPGISVNLGNGLFSIPRAVRMIDSGGIVRHIAAVGVLSAMASSSHGLLAAAVGQVQIVAATDSITPLAGMPDIGFTGDGGPATAATLAGLSGIAVSSSGAIYFSDPADARVRKIDPGGAISTFAGGGAIGSSGDGGTATAAGFDAPEGLAIDAKGDVYIADALAGVVRMVNSKGIITTVAGGGGLSLPQSYPVPATSALLLGAYRVSVDSAGNLYILDNNHIVKKVSASDQSISIVGTGAPTNQTGLGRSSSVDAMTVDPHDNLYVVYAPSGSPATITKVAPNGQLTLVNWIVFPTGGASSIAVDSTDVIYVGGFGFIRKYSPDGTLLTIAGSAGAIDILQDGPAPRAVVQANAIALTPAGDLYVADTWYERIRRVNAASCATFKEPAIGAVVNAASLSGGLAPGEIVSLFGVWMGPDVGAIGQLDANGKLETSVGGVSVLVNGSPVPVYYASAGQINAEIPLAAARNSVMTVQVQYGGVVSDPSPLYLQNASPGIFGSVDSNGRVAAVLNADGTVNSAKNPAPRGSVVSMFATGGGLTNPPIPDGVPAASAVPLALPATVSVNNIPAPLSYAGAAPSLVGVTQVNFQIPSDPGIVAGYNSLMLVVGGPAGTDTSGIYVK